MATTAEVSGEGNGEQQPSLVCCKCNISLLGQKYIQENEDQTCCLKCFEEFFSNSCELCKKKIGPGSKNLAFKEKHWHEECFFCSECKANLTNVSFNSKDDVLFCQECYADKFGQRCDKCSKLFQAGSNKFEYKGKNYHNECFTCVECSEPLGTKSFVPKDHGIVCITCYEDKYSQKCSKCTKPIQKDGLTYKGSPWHKECFVCVKCNKTLAGQKFTSKDDQPYCAECFTDLFAKRCHKCKEPISGFGGCKFVTFEENNWHSDCFTCSTCSTSLVSKGFIIKDDGVLCTECAR